MKSSRTLQEPTFSSLVDLLRRRADQQSDAVAYTFLEEPKGEKKGQAPGDGESQGGAKILGSQLQEGRTLTYGELDTSARAIAASLGGSEAKGERALLLHPPGPDFIEAFFGCLYAGVVAVPAYPPRSLRSLPRLRAVASSATPRFGLTSKAGLGQLGALAGAAEELSKVQWLASDELATGETGSWRDPGVESETLAFLQYTSGSTAAPKGVMVSHGNLLYSEEMIRLAFDQSRDSVIVGWLPMYHDMGLIGNVLQPLFLGAPCYLMTPMAFLQRPRRWLEAISTYRGTTSGGPNFAFDLCVRKVPQEQREGLDLSSWRVAFNGAEPVRSKTLERFTTAFEPQGFDGRAFLPCYGLAEATLLVSGQRSTNLAREMKIDAAELALGSAVEAVGEGKAVRLVTSGLPAASQRIEVVDPETLQLCPEGAVGEIWLQGPNVAAGYWGLKEKTAEIFGGRLAGSESSEPFLRTGDLGFEANGELFVTGRLKDLIIIRGRNHYPQDIELTSETSHAGLRPGCSAAFSVSENDEEILVLVQEVRREFRHGDLAEMETSIRLAIAEHHDLRVGRVVLVPPGAVAKTSSGKVRRAACRQTFLAGELQALNDSSEVGSEQGSTTSANQPSGPTSKKAEGVSKKPEDRALRRTLLLTSLKKEAGRLLRVSPQELPDDGALPLDSLAAMELKAGLEAALGVELSLAAFFEGPTPADLADMALAAVAANFQTPGKAPAEKNLPTPSSYPLSRGQEALWFLERLTPGTSAYHVSFAVGLGAGVDADVLRRSFQVLVDRHDSLRTAFRSRKGKPAQEVLDGVDVPWFEVDSSGWSHEELRQRLKQSAEEPFDLTKGALLRLTLFRGSGSRSSDSTSSDSTSSDSTSSDSTSSDSTRPYETVLLAVFHHIVIDLWSLVVLCQELELVYTALSSGQSPSFVGSPAKYFDFVTRQRQVLEGSRGDELWSYWSSLRDAPQVLELPTDRTRPAFPSRRGASVAFSLTDTVGEQLTAAASATGTTVFSFLLATFQALLQRTTGQDEFLVGSPAAGRDRAGVEGLVGYLVNPVVLRSNLAGDPSFVDHARRTARTVVEALEHQAFPFPMLVERLQPQRDPGRPPLVQAIFTLEQPHRLVEEGLGGFILGSDQARLQLGDLELTSLPMEKTVVQFDLELVVAEEGSSGSYGVVLHYSTDLFDVATMERFCGHFGNLLSEAVEGPEQRLSELAWLTAAERQQLLSEWNETSAPMAEEPLFHRVFGQRVQEDPNALAVVFDTVEAGQRVQQSLSYDRLDRWSSQVAHALVARGVGPEMRVGVALPRSLELIVSLLAVFKAGGCYVPMDPSYPRARLEYMLEDSGLKVVLSKRSVARQLDLFGDRGSESSEAELLFLDPLGEEWNSMPETPPKVSLDPLNAAYAIYTSGSTGQPKGALLPHLGLVNLGLRQSLFFAVRPGRRMLQFAALSFDGTMSEISQSLLSGATICLARREDLLPGPQFLALLQRLRITHMILPSSALAVLGTADLPDLEAVVLAGEALSQELVDRWGQHYQVFNAYGPTEASVCSTLTRCSVGAGKPSIGRALDNVRIIVLDRWLRLVPVGVAGELCVGGVSVGRGYLGRPGRTAERFVPHPFPASPGERLYRTGDLARWRPEGDLDFLGRMDDQVKVRGFRVEPGEIEAVLASHPGVAEGVVVKRDDLPGGGGLVAYAVAKPGSEVSVDELRDSLRERLPDHMVPMAFVLLPALPRTPSDKLDRRSLPAPVLGGQGEKAPPRSTLERAAAEVWQRVLGLEEAGSQAIGLDDNLFELGGHSLLVPRLQEELKTVFGRELSAVEIFQYPTLRSLVEHAVGGEETTDRAQTGRERARQRLSLSRQEHRQDRAVAIVGMACRFPGASNPQELWHNLEQGVESVRALSEAELEAAGVTRAARETPGFVASAVELEGLDLFDAGYFGFSPKEAEVMDPQHRIFLECCVEALEDAVCDPDGFGGDIGVFAGAGFESYLLQQVAANPAGPAAAYQLSVANMKDFLASRVAYKLGLEGPAVAVQTACSTSLVAVHLACQSLLAGECDAVLAGAVSLELPHLAGYQYQPGMILSPDGHCRPFDAEARGTVRGSGAGVVVLKRLADAVAAGDRIRAVIRGSAINNDGARKVGYTAPSVDRQTAVIAEAQTVAGVDASTVSYLEAHGTGTELGDPIEVEALKSVFGSAGLLAGSGTGSRTRSGSGSGASSEASNEASNEGSATEGEKLSAWQGCALGSVKSNLGHLDTASGIAGLIKTVLALEQEKIPPSLNFVTPNPRLGLENSPFFVPTAVVPWPRGEALRRAGVSSFGIGGTNAHVVLEDVPAVPHQSTAKAREWQLLAVSAASDTALDRSTERLSRRLSQARDLDLADAAYTLQVGRRALPHRRIILSHSLEDATTVLETSDPERILDGRVVGGSPSVAFLFPGQGSQHVEMAQGIYRSEEVFRRQLDECCQLLEPHLQVDLRRILFPPSEEKEGAARRLTETRLAQPALFAVEYSLARLWVSWGVEPEALLGHSIGEWVAACLAGVLDLPDALALVALRGQLMQEMAPGSMLAVSSSEAEVAPFLEPDLELAAVNGPRALVLSGPESRVDSLARELRENGIDCRLLHTSHAFHSAAMEPAAEAFEAAVAKVPLAPPTRPMVSNLTGDWTTPEEVTDPAYWARHLRHPVLFAAGLETLLEEPNRLLLEVGPGNALATLARQHEAKSLEQMVVSSLPHPRETVEDQRYLLSSLARLWLGGAPVDWPAFYHGQGRRPVAMPTYPFERQRFWVDARSEAHVALAGDPRGAGEADRQDLADWFYHPYWKPLAVFGDMVPEPGERWLLFLDEGGLGAELARQLRAAGCEPVLVTPGEAFGRHQGGNFTVRPDRREDYRSLLEALKEGWELPFRILHCWTAENDQLPETAMQRGFYSVLALVQALGEDPPAEPTIDLTLVTREARAVGREEVVSPEKAALLGTCRVLPQEYPWLACRLFDVGPQESGAAQEVLARTLLGEVQRSPSIRGDSSVLAHRDGEFWAEDFSQVPLAARPEASHEGAFRVGGTYLITGGFGGLGAVFARHLASTYSARLILLGRSAPPPRAQWANIEEEGTDSGAIARLRLVRELEDSGSEVMLVSADVTDSRAMAVVLLQAREHFGALDGVLHAAGVAGGGVAQAKERSAVESVLAPKLAGTRALTEAIAEVHTEKAPELLVLFSSLASTLGGFGQLEYCAANNALEAFAQEAARQAAQDGRGRRICAVSWGAWREVGMAASSSMTSSSTTGSLTTSAEGIDPAQGVEALERILTLFPRPQVLVSPVPLNPLRRAYGQPIDAAELASRLARGAPEVVGGNSQRHPRPLLQNRLVEPEGDLEEALVEIWCELLGLEEVGVLDNFFELGGTSLVGIQLVARIKEQLGIELPAVSLYQGSTVKALAEVIERSRNREKEVEPSSRADSRTDSPVGSGTGSGDTSEAGSETGRGSSRGRGARRRERARARRDSVREPAGGRR